MVCEFEYRAGPDEEEQVHEHDLSLEWDDETEEFVAVYVINGEVRNVGREDSVNKAVIRLARQMELDIYEALDKTRYFEDTGHD